MLNKVLQRAESHSAATDHLLREASRVILGKDHQLRLALACILARGHLLIEDLPGVGKTTLAHVMAHLLGLEFQRIQFTSDLLPADIIGVSVYDRDNAGFRFHPGPVFSQFILADEINRATPKTQSALLEAMEENQVTAEGETRKLPQPFVVIATQNPTQQIGTFPLPESQLDRFLMRIELGYPDANAERELLKGRDRRDIIATLQPCLNGESLREIQAQVSLVHVSDALIDYAQALIAHTRRPAHYISGLSPRAGLALLHCAQAWALLDGRKHVIPEDVQAVLPAVVGHRLHRLNDHGAAKSAETVREFVESVPIP
ncbi:MAG: MoxR family ATPase [Burkholderiales bacterium]